MITSSTSPSEGSTTSPASAKPAWCPASRSKPASNWKSATSSPSAATSKPTPASTSTCAHWYILTLRQHLHDLKERRSLLKFSGRISPPPRLISRINITFSWRPLKRVSSSFSALSTDSLFENSMYANLVYDRGLE